MNGSSHQRSKRPWCVDGQHAQLGLNEFQELAQRVNHSNGYDDPVLSQNVDLVVGHNAVPVHQANGNPSDLAAQVLLTQVFWISLNSITQHRAGHLAVARPQKSFRYRLIPFAHFT